MDIILKLAIVISKEINIDTKKIVGFIYKPEKLKAYDYTFPCYCLSEQLKKPAHLIAQELAEKIQLEEIDKIEIRGPYINFFLNINYLLDSIIKDNRLEVNFYKASTLGRNYSIDIIYYKGDKYAYLNKGLQFEKELSDIFYRIHTAVGYNVGNKLNYYVEDKTYENLYEDKLKNKLINIKVIKKYYGVDIVEFKKENIAPLIVTKKDRMYTDTFKVISKIAENINRNKVNNIIYLINSFHKITYRQLMNVIQLLGYDKSIDIKLFEIGKVKIIDNIYSINSVDILLDEVYNRVLEYISIKYNDDNLKSIAKDISKAAILFEYINNFSNINIILKLERIVSLVDNNFLYIQQVYSIANEMILQYKKSENYISNYTTKSEDNIKLIKELAQFENCILNTVKKLDLRILSNYIVYITELLNNVLNNNESVEKKVKLIQTTCVIIEKGLYLLGININVI